VAIDILAIKPEARPARALPVGAQMHFSGPTRNHGWVALTVRQNGGEKHRSTESPFPPSVPTGEGSRMSIASNREECYNKRIILGNRHAN